MQKKILYPVIVTALTLLAAALLIITAEPVRGDKEARSALKVSAVRAKAADIQFQVHSQGSIEPRIQSELIPEVSGVVAWVSPSLVAGGSMRKGEALLRIEKADYESELSSAKAALARAESRLRRTRQEYERMRTLQTRKLASEAQLESSESEFQVAEANHAEAKALLAKAKRDLARTTLMAPYDGLVRSESVDVGQFISRGQSIATIYATDFVEVRLPIADSQLAFLDLDGINSGKLKPTAQLRGIFAGQERHWQAEIDRMEAQIDARSRMLNAVAHFKPQTGAQAPVGLFVKAKIQGLHREKLFSLPRSALRSDGNVLLIEDGRLRRREVTVLRLEDQRAIISAGLKDGDIVCTSRNQALSQGTEVEADIQP